MVQNPGKDSQNIYLDTYYECTCCTSVARRESAGAEEEAEPNPGTMEEIAFISHAFQERRQLPCQGGSFCCAQGMRKNSSFDQLINETMRDIDDTKNRYRGFVVQSNCMDRQSCEHL